MPTKYVKQSHGLWDSPFCGETTRPLIRATRTLRISHADGLDCGHCGIDLAASCRRILDIRAPIFMIFRGPQALDATLEKHASGRGGATSKMTRHTAPFAVA